MGKRVALLAVALLWAWGAGALEYDYTVTSAKSVDQALEAVTAAAQADGFKVPGVHTLPAPADYVLVELCDPEEARELFAVDLKLGLLLPCGRIGVYKDTRDGGKTKISLLLPTTTSRLHPAPEVAVMGKRLEPRMKKIVDRAR